MALKVFAITVKPGVSFPASEGLNSIVAVDALLTTAKADAATADTANNTALTDTTTADTNADSAKTAVDTAKTSTAAAIANFPSRVATQAAVDVLVADGAIPTQAHVNDLVTAWNTFKTNLTTHETSATTADTNTGTAQTAMNTAETAVDTALASVTTAETAVDTAVASLAAVSLTADIVSGDVIIQVDNVTVTTKTQLRAAWDAFYRHVSSSNLFGA